MSPMTRNRATEAHVPTALMAEYYKQRASTEGTLIITEATVIAERESGQKNVPGIWNDKQIEEWKKVCALPCIMFPTDRARCANNIKYIDYERRT
jgi:NADPH2 dehydrogenase